MFYVYKQRESIDMFNKCSYYLQHSHSVSDSTWLFQLNTEFKSREGHNRYTPKFNFDRTGIAGIYRCNRVFTFNLKQFNNLSSFTCFR
jgi:hypothetical protein